MRIAETVFDRHPFYRNSIAIDALRGLAALLVLFAHADAHNLIRFPVIELHKGSFGQIGVYLFFIMSGYLIWVSAGRTLGRPGGLVEYSVHRATRIMPLYYVALLFAILLFPLLSTFRQQIDLNTILRHVTFTQAFNPSVSRAINPVLWTLTMEAAFYCLVPLLFLLRRHFYALIGLAVLAYWVGWTYWPGMTVSPFLRLFFLFVIGMFLANYELTPKPLLFAIALAVALIAGFATGPGMWVSIAWAVAIFCGIAAIRRFETSLPLRFFGFFGVISYSLYIWHYMLIEMIGPVINSMRQFPVRHPYWSAILFIAICAALSYLSYRLIEKPGQTTLRRKILERIGRRAPSTMPAQ